MAKSKGITAEYKSLMKSMSNYDKPYVMPKAIGKMEVKTTSMTPKVNVYKKDRGLAITSAANEERSHGFVITHIQSGVSASHSEGYAFYEDAEKALKKFLATGIDFTKNQESIQQQVAVMKNGEEFKKIQGEFPMTQVWDEAHVPQYIPAEKTDGNLKITKHPITGYYSVSLPDGTSLTEIPSHHINNALYVIKQLKSKIPGIEKLTSEEDLIQYHKESKYDSQGVGAGELFHHNNKLYQHIDSQADDIYAEENPEPDAEENPEPDPEEDGIYDYSWDAVDSEYYKGKYANAFSHHLRTIEETAQKAPELAIARLFRHYKSNPHSPVAAVGKAIVHQLNYGDKDESFKDFMSTHKQHIGTANEAWQKATIILKDPNFKKAMKKHQRETIKMLLADPFVRKTPDNKHLILYRSLDEPMYGKDHALASSDWNGGWSKPYTYEHKVPLNSVWHTYLRPDWNNNKSIWNASKKFGHENEIVIDNRKREIRRIENSDELPKGSWDIDMRGTPEEVYEKGGITKLIKHPNPEYAKKALEITKDKYIKKNNLHNQRLRNTHFAMAGKSYDSIKDMTDMKRADYVKLKKYVTERKKKDREGTQAFSIKHLKDDLGLMKHDDAIQYKEELRVLTNKLMESSVSHSLITDSPEKFIKENFKDVVDESVYKNNKELQDFHDDYKRGVTIRFLSGAPVALKQKIDYINKNNIDLSESHVPVEDLLAFTNDSDVQRFPKDIAKIAMAYMGRAYYVGNHLPRIIPYLPADGDKEKILSGFLTHPRTNPDSLRMLVSKDEFNNPTIYKMALDHPNTDKIRPDLIRYSNDQTLQTILNHPKTTSEDLVNYISNPDYRGFDKKLEVSHAILTSPKSDNKIKSAYMRNISLSFSLNSSSDEQKKKNREAYATIRSGDLDSEDRQMFLETAPTPEMREEILNKYPDMDLPDSVGNFDGLDNDGHPSTAAHHFLKTVLNNPKISKSLESGPKLRHIASSFLGRLPDSGVISDDEESTLKQAISHPGINSDPKMFSDFVYANAPILAQKSLTKTILTQKNSDKLDENAIDSLAEHVNLRTTTPEDITEIANHPAANPATMSRLIENAHKSSQYLMGQDKVENSKNILSKVSHIAETVLGNKHTDANHLKALSETITDIHKRGAGIPEYQESQQKIEGHMAGILNHPQANPRLLEHVIANAGHITGLGKTINEKLGKFKNNVSGLEDEAERTQGLQTHDRMTTSWMIKNIEEGNYDHVKKILDHPDIDSGHMTLALERAKDKMYHPTGAGRSTDESIEGANKLIQHIIQHPKMSNDTLSKEKAKILTQFANDSKAASISHAHFDLINNTLQSRITQDLPKPEVAHKHENLQEDIKTASDREEPDLRKTVYDKTTNFGQHIISPDGTVHPMKDDEEHYDKIRELSGKTYNDTTIPILKQGWIMVGHAGRNELSAHKDIIENSSHPATKALRKLMKEKNPDSYVKVAAHSDDGYLAEIYEVPMHQATSGNFKRPSKTQMFRSLIDSSLDKMGKLGLTGKEQFKKIVEWELKKSELLRKDEMYRPSKRGAKVHGFITPEGEFNRIGSDEKHEDAIASHLETEKNLGHGDFANNGEALNHAVYEEGYITTGHGGLNVFAGSKKILENINHPATKALARLIKEHLSDEDSIDISHEKAQYQVPIKSAIAGNFKRPSDVQMFRSLIDSSLDKMAKLGLTGKEQFKKIVEWELKKSEVLRKDEMMWLTPDEQGKMAPLHGWISPEGKFHQMEKHEVHSFIAAKIISGSTVEDYRQKNPDADPSHELYSKGWISTGHGGRHVISGHSDFLDNPQHPATKKVAKMLLDHGARHIEVVQSDTQDVHVVNDKKLKHSNFRSPSKTQMFRSELSESDSVLRKDEMWGLQPEEIEDAMPTHGWISPKGEYHQLGEDDKHSVFAIHETDRQGLRGNAREAVDTLHRQGWISIGHAGAATIAGHSKYLNDPQHPASKKAAKMINQSPLPSFYISHEDTHDANIVENTGKVRHLKGSAFKKCSILSESDSILQKDVPETVKKGTK